MIRCKEADNPVLLPVIVIVGFLWTDNQSCSQRVSHRRGAQAISSQVGDRVGGNVLKV